MAEMLGKEAAMYTMSGTMANLLAVMSHCTKRSSEVLIGDKAHMFRWSQGNISQVRMCMFKQYGEILDSLKHDNRRYIQAWHLQFNLKSVLTVLMGYL